jgi:hypothetical protein
MRFLATFTVTNGVILLLKPDFAFTRRGEFKSFSLTDPMAKSSEKTLIPWWAPGLILGITASILV